MAAVSFDADGTLWDFDAVMRNALGIALDAIRDECGRLADGLTVEAMIATRERVAAEHDHQWANLEDIRLRAFEATLHGIGVDDPDLAAKLNARYLHHRFADIELFEDVLPCLDEVAREHAVGLLSNGNTVPERCGLDGRFDFTVFASDHGAAKPDPALFRVAAAQAGCDIRELVHVGDDEADVHGARRAGCTGVLIVRDRTWPPHADLADAVIGDLRALPALLTELAATGTER